MSLSARQSSITTLPHAVRRHRTLFISDTHLGTRACQAELLADFLAHNDCQTLYLIGDIIDGWRLRRAWYWAPAHGQVIREILRKADSGTRVIYIPGNHDEVFRNYCGLVLAGVETQSEAVHVTAGGKRFLVIHGDEFDGILSHAKWLAHLGDHAYQLAVRLNTLFNRARRRAGMPYWSLSAYLKSKVKNAAKFVCAFETALAREARRRELDGVVCGHIHQAEIKTIDGILYLNDGDCVESCTALAEDMSGRLSILHWPQLAAENTRPAKLPARIKAVPVAA